MDSNTAWIVVVVRGWSDDDGFKIRLLMSDSAGRNEEVAVGTRPQALRLLHDWLAEVELACGGP